ncbi:MAG: hypothetical protein M1830_003240 [Pleopsidium flavum]|nr:MAG: hypothetical protein M1830_003240 [Pleopsidium flavum]
MDVSHRHETIENSALSRQAQGIESRDGTQASSNPPSTEASPSHNSNDSSTQPAHQRLVFTDPVAFRYLEEDPLTTVLERRRRLTGYELYIVEQWACSRVHPTFVITTYTADPSHSVLVGVLSVPTDENAWSPRLRVYFKAVAQFHARRKDTSLGTLMVTNLSGFPSALTVIAVPDGDVKKHREDFIVNENLKRLGCSGRAGLNLLPPTGATQAKFHLLYRTSDRIPLYNAVIELVKLCQVALMLFAKLAPEYVDGLLCDVTEQAINDWWTELGTDFYNIEPSDGILGPTTVAALLGMLMGARNRLNAYGAPVGKDAFDISSLKRGIAYFQKSQKMERTRRLDRQTLDRLHRVTAKAASGDGWNVPKAVKSTVAELSGKGGEMVMGMVGAREKAGIGEVETMDIERFIELVHGERSKWLWFGKPRKTMGNDFSNLVGEEGMVFGKDEQGGYVWSSKKRDSVADESGSRLRDTHSVYLRPAAESQMSLDPGDKDQQLRKTVFKSVTGKMSDARSGFGRIKDAVGIPGFRGHHHRISKDTNVVDEDTTPANQDRHHHSEVTLTPIKSASPLTRTSTEKLNEIFRDPLPSESELNVAEQSKDTSTIQGSVSRDTAYPEFFSRSKSNDMSIEEGQYPSEAEKEAAEPRRRRGSAPGAVPTEHSTAGSIYRGSDYEDVLPAQQSMSRGKAVGILLQRRQSVSDLSCRPEQKRSDSWWPRHLSFSTVEDAVLSWEDISLIEDDGSPIPSDVARVLMKEQAMAKDAKIMRTRILQLQDHIGLWVVKKIDDIEALDLQGSRDQEELVLIHNQQRNEYQSLRTSTDDLLAREKMSLREASTDVELLGAKLEYELNALQSKVAEVEDGVATFEQLVTDVEARTQELEADDVTQESWLWWVFRLFTGAPLRT